MAGARVARITIMIGAEVAPGTDLPVVAHLGTKSNNSQVKMAKVVQIIGETLIMTSARVATHRTSFNLHRPLADGTTLKKATRKLTTIGVGKRAMTTSLALAVIKAADINAPPIVVIQVRKIKVANVEIDERVIKPLAKVVAMLDRDWLMNQRLRSQELIKLSKRARMTVEVIARKAHLLPSLKQTTIKIDKTRTTTGAEISHLKTVVATRAKRVQMILNLVIKAEDVTLEAQRPVINLESIRKAANNRRNLETLKSLKTITTTTGNNSNSLSLRKSIKDQTTRTAGPNLYKSRGKGP